MFSPPEESGRGCTPLTPISFIHLHSGIRFLPYHGPACLHPALRTLIQECDVRRAAAGLPTPGGSEALHIQFSVASEVVQTSGGGGGGGGGRGGGRSRRLQRDNSADAGSGTRHGRKGALIANPVCIPVLTLRAGRTYGMSSGM